MIIEIAGMKQPAPAPRFSRTVAEVTSPPAHPGQHSREILESWGFSATDIDRLVSSGAVVDA
jgi:alpha-methylacyl-CoA racemase